MRTAVLCLTCALICPFVLFADDWPQWLGPQRDAVWRETGILSAFPKDGPKILWRKPIGMGYAGPAVANGRVYVHDRHVAKGPNTAGNGFQSSITPGDERIVCLNEKTGEMEWEYKYECTYTVQYS